MKAIERELPPGWAQVEIEEVLAPQVDGRILHHGWSPQCDAEPRVADDEWGVLKTTAIQDGNFAPQHNKRLPPHLSPRPELAVHDGDLLLTCAGPRARCGVPCLVRRTPPRLILSGKMYRFRVSEAVMAPAFLEAQLRSPRVQVAIDAMKTGISDSGLNLTHGRFLALSTLVPPLPEQRRIVEALDTQFTRLDAAVATLERVRENLERCRISVLRAAVEGRLRRTAASVQGLPTVWQRERMPALAKILSGNTPAGIAALAAGSGEIPWFRVGDMNEPGNEVFLDRSRTWLTRTEVAKLGLRILPRGTIVFPKRGGAIHTNKKRMLTRDSTIDLNTMALVPEQGVGPWLWLWMQQLDLCALADGSNVPQINHSDVAPLEVPLPPAEERDEIVEHVDRYLSDIDAAGDQVTLGILRCVKLRQSLLRNAFDGCLVPQDPHDEPASVLLDRIRTERAAVSPFPTVKSTKSRR
jgi:type I restriction enzyme S subunit